MIQALQSRPYVNRSNSGQQQLYWGKDLPRALSEAGATVGDSIIASRTGSKIGSVKELQEGADGIKREVTIDGKRNTWKIDNHGVDPKAVIKVCDTLVKDRQDRQKLETTAPLLVAKRDQAVVELKRQKLASEFAHQNQQHPAFSL